MTYIKKLMASSAAGLGGALIIAGAASALSGTNTVDSGDIIDGAVHTADIATNAVTASKIATNAVGSNEIAAGAVHASEIAGGAVASSEIATGAVGAAEIAADAVNSAEIAASAVGSSELGADAVTASKISDGAVGTAAVATDGIGSAEIQADAVGTSEIATDGVAAAEIATSAVTTTEILNATITGTDVATTADLDVDSVTLADAVAGDTESGQVASAVTVPTGGSGSFQTIWGDLTYEGAAGGTSAYHAGMMGNFMGDTLTNTNTVNHAGVIGKYSVTTSDATDGPNAGVVGEAETSVADAAVMAVIGGDGGAVTPGAAYGVQYMNSTAGTKFAYGLDLFRDGSSSDYGAASSVDFGTADIRLAAGTTISSGSANPATCVTGSLFLDTDGGADATLRACTATNTWTAVSNE